MWLGKPGHTQSTIAVYHATFLWQLSPSKKSKTLIVSFLRNWWPKNPTIWLDKCTSQTIILKFVNYVVEKISGGINWSFILNYFWSSHSPRWSKGTCSKSGQFWEWLGKPGHTKPKAVVTELQSKKWYWCIPSRYWWSKNPAIWLDESILFYYLPSRTLSDMGFAQKNREL